MTQFKISFLPTILKSPEYPVCKKNLYFFLEAIEYLEWSHILVRADEQVYARISDLMWKQRDLYLNIILLMGGVHQLRVFQSILMKHYGCLEFQRLVS